HRRTCRLDWLARPLVADGVVVADALDPARLMDANLPQICLRMMAILDTIEMPRAEGRLMPIELFNGIDTLAARLQHPKSKPPRPTEWESLVRGFGEYYDLTGTGPIKVDAALWHAAVSRLGVVAEKRQDAKKKW